MLWRGFFFLALVCFSAHGYDSDKKCTLYRGLGKILSGRRPTPAFLQRLFGNVAPWKFTPEQEADFARTWQGLDPDLMTVAELNAKVHELYLKIINAVLENHPKQRNELIRPFADALNPYGGYVPIDDGPHYNPIDNRIWNPIKDPANPTAAELIVGIHESGHAYQRNTNPWPMILSVPADLAHLLTAFPILPFSPLLTLNIESHSIGGQWELTRRIPPRFREALARAIESEPTEGRNLEAAINRIALASLQNADNPAKPDFIRHVSPEHRYAGGQLYTAYVIVHLGWTLRMLAVSLPPLMDALVDGDDPDQIPAWDIWALYHAIAYVTDHESTKTIPLANGSSVKVIRRGPRIELIRPDGSGVILKNGKLIGIRKKGGRLAIPRGRVEIPREEKQILDSAVDEVRRRQRR